MVEAFYQDSIMAVEDGSSKLKVGKQGNKQIKPTHLVRSGIDLTTIYQLPHSGIQLEWDSLACVQSRAISASSLQKLSKQGIQVAFVHEQKMYTFYYVKTKKVL